MSYGKLGSIQNRVYRRHQAKVFDIWDASKSKTANQLLKPCSYFSGPVRHIRHIYSALVIFWPFGKPAIW